MMVKLLFLTILFFDFLGVQIPDLIPDDKSSKVSFRIRNLGIPVEGTMKDLTGDIKFDSTHLTESAMDVSIAAASVNTGISLRDNHLRGEDYLNVQKYPRIRFVSTGFRKRPGEFNYVVSGRLTIRETTRLIDIPFLVRSDNGGLRFTGQFELDRTDFHVGGNSFTLSDHLTVFLTVFAKN